MALKHYIPILDWLPNYQKSYLEGDLSAGLTVGVMLIPQGMAYAMLAGLPPIYGLYASIVPLIIYAVLGTSRQLAVGPVAMISLLVAATALINIWNHTILDDLHCRLVSSNLEVESRRCSLDVASPAMLILRKLSVSRTIAINP